MITNSMLLYMIQALLGIGFIAAIIMLRLNKKKYAREMSKKLAQSERYFELLRSASAVVWQYDYSTKKLSAAYTDEIGKQGADSFFEVPDFRKELVASGQIHPSSIPTFNEFCDRFTSGQDHCGCELKISLRSQPFHWYAIYGVMFRSKDGSPKKFYGQMVDINDSYTRFDKIAQERADTDTLTRLLTRYGMEKRVNEWIENNPDSPGALFLIDVDHFRQISENIGSIFGEELLVELSRRLIEIFPDDSIIGRVSYDEFIVFVKNIGGREAAGSYASACCSCMENFFLNTDQTERVTCSVGAVLSPEESRVYEQLFYKADVALFMSKFSGRNTYRVYEEGMDQDLAELAGDTKMEEDPETELDSANKLYNASLLSQVIEMLFESRELSSSINMTMSLIGRKLDFDYCGISKYNDSTGGVRDYKYTWYSKKLRGCELPSMPAFCQNGSYFYCRHIEELDAETRLPLEPYEKAGVKSFVQCPVMEGAVLCGFITYCVCEPDRELHEETLQEVSLVSKIIGGYLLQLKAMEDIKHFGEVDRLTGTMSLNRFISETERIISENPDRNFAIVFADIDRFKFINETYGYKAGDNILIRLAQIVSSMQGTNELLTRVNDDKFAGLFEYGNLSDLKKRLLTCDHMINSIKKTDTDCYKLPLRAGIYLIGKGDTSVSSMVDKANLARKTIHNVSKSTYVMFDEAMKSRLKRQREIEEVMREALEKNEFVVYFQPKFSLAKGQLVGAEALVRWKRPGAGLIRPDEFIPIFEDNGFIVDLDFYVLELVCKKLRRDMDSGLPTKPIAVNFSRVHLGSPDFIPQISKYLEKYDIPANLIEIEITESALTDDEDYLVGILQSLHKLGLIVSMDDFGSGYSSLNLLKKLPFDVLKIDKDFFTGNTANEREKLIIENVVNMAKSLNIRVVSEGVETKEQADFLRGIQCDQVQGFLYAHPMDMESFEKKYQKGQESI